jgi:hypothetical protein
MKRLRGVLLKLLCTNHDEQASRFDSSALWSALIGGLRFDVPLNDVHTALQDLKARGYVTFEQRKDKKNGDIFITLIELCPKGRDLLEETITDPAVELL